MSAFSEFFLMKPDDVKRYAAEVLHRFDPDEETTCTEIGDGNINYVFRVRSLRDGRSVIVKQADKRLRFLRAAAGHLSEQDRGAGPAAGVPAGAGLHPGGLPL